MKKIKRFMKKKKDCIKKILAWDYWLLSLSIVIPIALLLVVYLNHSLINWLKQKLGLEFFQIFILIGAILTTLWTNKRQTQRKKQYKQTEDTIFLNKVNTIYLEVIKLLSDKEHKKQPIAKNLINAIQASINFHYEGKSEEVKNKAKFKILNFSGMDLSSANLIGVNLSGANLNGTYLRKSDLSIADLSFTDLSFSSLYYTYLSGANLSNANLSGAKFNYAKLSDTNFTNAKNIPQRLKEILEKN